ncbi:hypothetical protein ONE63_004560 [Megalurothrips usitatus]|uniref:Uncharacterized protein n=1 Tax=Megalurothrips usitatus TaxID=439358 RepID=A0AAV7X3E0_9NEOP|nr:hypothetical protein ONE63_004560 [Megalurothrips usitatus]
MKALPAHGRGDVVDGQAPLPRHSLPQVRESDATLRKLAEGPTTEDLTNLKDNCLQAAVAASSTVSVSLPLTLMSLSVQVLKHPNAVPGEKYQ